MQKKPQRHAERDQIESSEWDDGRWWLAMFAIVLLIVVIIMPLVVICVCYTIMRRQAQIQPGIMTVQIPAGLSPDQQMCVSTPEGMLLVTTPPGAVAGQTIQVLRPNTVGAVVVGQP